MLTIDVPHITREVYRILETVKDPEVPVLSILDLGIVRQVSVSNPFHEQVNIDIVITPTYSGCPAMDVISMTIRFALMQHGYLNLNIASSLSPAWTTDWMTEAGRQKLKAYGIAPPHARHNVPGPDAFENEETVVCPLCNAHNTHLISRFGSTACKALYQCDDCREPFDYFKCH